MTEMVKTAINGRWQLLLPEHRAARPEWPWWEATRLAAEHHVIEELSLHPSIYGSSRARPVVYCVGAEEGDFPALYAQWGADVVLFEPNERVWPNIKAIFEANHLEDRILGGFAGFAAADFVEDSWRESSSSYRSWPDCADGPVIGDHGFCNLWERDDIDRITLTRCLPWVGAPDVITIDVEGAELEVLKGARELLESELHHPAVFVSIHPEFIKKYDAIMSDVIHFMTGVGYEGRYLCTDHEEHWYFQHPERRMMEL